MNELQFWKNWNTISNLFLETKAQSDIKALQANLTTALEEHTKAQSDIQALQSNLTTALEELAKITQRPFKGILFLCPFIPL